MELTYNNNDIGTFFVGTGSWISTLLFYALFKKFLTDRDPNKYESTFLSVLFFAFFFKNVDSFRLFKTVTVSGEIVPTKIFFHDTRRMTTNFYFDKNDNFRIYNSQSGDNTLYVSTLDNVFTVCKNKVPYFLLISEPGNKVHVSAWKYFFSSSPYEIFSAKPLKN